MGRSGAVKNGIGQPVPRKEDRRLLTGRGCYVDDLSPDNLAHAVIVRSPHAHARIISIGSAATLAAPGVLAVLTATDYLADGLGPIPHGPAFLGPPDLVPRSVGPPPELTVHYPLAFDRIRYVGEPIALVVADTLHQAKDAAELLEIEYEVLPAIVRATDALKSDAPRVWDDHLGNLRAHIAAGDDAATSLAFERAAHVVRLETWIQRVTGVTMEPRTNIAEYDAATECFTLHSGVGRGVAKLRLDVAQVLRVQPEQVRVVCKDMGGSFGTRSFFYPEHATIPWAARRVGRPIKWTCERGEALLSDYQGRDLSVEVELALDSDGTFLAIRGKNLSNVGAYAAAFSPLQKGLSLMTGVYRIPVAYFEGLAAVTNTAPTGPYRSSGRPEVVYVLERLIDLAADQLGFDPIALRRKNIVPALAQPFTNAMGITYDSGDYADAMDAALLLGDWAGFSARREEAKARGRLRGIGVANYVEITTGAPRERTEITVLPEGKVELVVGTMSSGQGHETTFAQLVTEWLGVPFECIDFVAHDSARVSAGGGSHSGRSMKMATIIIGAATDEIIDKGRQIASHLFEVNMSDVEFDNGRYRVAGTDREADIFDIARAAVTRTDLAKELRGPLMGVSDQTLALGSFPYGAQVVEVEVDPQTGALEIVRYAAVDDVGRAINPLILNGQTHGGIAQGVGQALMEHCHYDFESGQLLSGSLMDYAMPRADRFPEFLTKLSEVPSPSNRLGVRSGGEGGTTAALAVLANAIVDALSEFGVRHIELPATPERVWRTIESARTEQTLSS